MKLVHLSLQNHLATVIARTKQVDEELQGVVAREEVLEVLDSIEQLEDACTALIRRCRRLSIKS